MIFRKILNFRKCYFPERKIFLSVWLHFRKCCEKYFLVFGCMVENAIFLQIFHTAIQPTAANSGNQKPQPPKHHHHTTTTTTKIKITQKSKSHRERDRWVKDRWVEGEIARRRDRRCDRHGAIVGLELARSTGACDRRGLWLARSTSACDRRGLELRVRQQSSD